MNHLKWMGHTATIFEIQRDLRNKLETCEVTLVGINGSVRAHRFVLSSCSELLRTALKDVPMDQETTIIVPDIRGSLLDSILAFIYMGETNITSTNLSEFLEAINTLGIRSAISFECNPSTAPSTQTAYSSSSPIKAVNTIQIAHDLFEQEQIISEKLVDADVVTEQQTTCQRNLNFVDIYHENEHKITYSIEHMPVAANTNDFILTENSESFTLTQSAKLEPSSECDKVEESIDDTDATHLIEEYSSSGETTIEDGSATNESASITPVTTYLSSVIAMKPKYKNCISKVQNQQMRKSATLDLPNKIEANTKSTSYTTTYDENVDDSLELAVQAVINEGISLQKAAIKFDLSKTVLWRKVRKHPDYMKTTRENPVLSMACERLKRGESLKSISKELDIPMSTLHRHKVRLAQQGRLPSYVTLRKRDSVTKDELKKKLIKAVHACVHQGMSQNQAANLYSIPKSTLWRHLQKRVVETEVVHIDHPLSNV